MFKISRLTDYGVVLLSHLARNRDHSMPCSARDLARLSGLPLPTVSKLLKILAKNQLVSAHRGAFGGYELMGHPRDLSVLKLIEAFEGKLATTACMKKSVHACAIDRSCSQKAGWLLVHRKVAQQLSEISLAELMNAGLDKGASL